MESQDKPSTDAKPGAQSGGTGAITEEFPGTRLIQIGLMTAGLLFNNSSQAAPVQVNKPPATGRASQSNAKVQDRPIRLVSLAPSNTELLAALGAADHLVGVCTYCDYPQQISSITRVGTFVSANLERLARLKPDAVLLVSGQEHLEAILKHNNFKTLVLKNNHLNDIGLNIKELARLVGKEGKGEALAKNLEDSLNSFHNIIGSANRKPRVFYCVWPKPLMTVGKSSFLDGVITACG
ncbi:MAG TPA: helical backbone metal receptor, partial [Candidatus Obscuribacter sp.]|nr:helical backbone metal receptor [Candidatus Obscuribacter sp.]